IIYYILFPTPTSSPPPHNMVENRDGNSRVGYGQSQQRSGQSASVPYGYLNNYSGNTRCPNCAKMHSFGACPARGTTCSICGKPNHWRIDCRSNRGRGGSYRQNNRTARVDYGRRPWVGYNKAY